MEMDNKLPLFYFSLVLNLSDLPPLIISTTIDQTHHVNFVVFFLCLVHGNHQVSDYGLRYQVISVFDARVACQEELCQTSNHLNLPFRTPPPI